jgi:membrane-associated phospholipid phosphatase
VSTANGLGTPVAAGWLRQLDTNARSALAVVKRPPRGGPAVACWTPAQLAAAAVLAVALVIATMFALDAWVIIHARRLPAALIVAEQRLTELGKAGWFLWPLGIVLLALAALDSPALPRFSRAILAAFAVRLGFVFVAVGLPSLFATIVKRLIGRGRPFVEGTDVFAYEPFSWTARYASMPSGHTTTAFAALVAIGAIFPQARALMWIYAVLIGLSRVIITAHHPSDVIAGAIVGAAGALLVRNWFAARRFGFKVTADGSVRSMPGPSLQRIIKAVAHRPQSA